MSGVETFPMRECIVVTMGTDAATGCALHVLEHVSAYGRIGVGEYRSREHAMAATEFWRLDGLPIVMADGDGGMGKITSTTPPVGKGVP